MGAANDRCGADGVSRQILDQAYMQLTHPLADATRMACLQNMNRRLLLHYGCPMVHIETLSGILTALMMEARRFGQPVITQRPPYTTTKRRYWGPPMRSSSPKIGVLGTKRWVRVTDTPPSGTWSVTWNGA